jgi:hypothetical protein
MAKIWDISTGLVASLSFRHISKARNRGHFDLWRVEWKTSKLMKHFAMLIKIQPHCFSFFAYSETNSLINDKQ